MFAPEHVACERSDAVPFSSMSWEAEIWRRAEGLREGWLPSGDLEAGPAAVARYRLWLRYMAEGDGFRMRRLLAAAGFWPSAARLRRTAPEPPSWARTLRRVMAAARTAADCAPDPLAKADIPFAAILVPCVQVARTLRTSLLIDVETIATGKALAELDLALLRRLSEAASPTLISAFDRHHPSDPISILFEGASAAAPRGAYDTFVAMQLSDGYANLFEAHPALARCLCRIVEQTAEAQAELLNRLLADRAVIAEAFCGGRDPLPVRTIAPSLSDPHAGGRMVARLGLADGTALAYKPRPVDMEAGFSAVLGWLNERQCSHPHRVPRVVARDDYGWMEWIENAACRDQAEAEAFYWRAGSLFALYHTLGGSDLHYENLVAAGGHPVLVDVECLMHPEPQTFQKQSIPPDLITPAILTGGFLPLYTFAQDGWRPVNFGALGPSCGPDGIEEKAYVHINTDWMRPIRRAPPISASHLPRIGERVLDVRDHLDALLEGWRDSIELLVQHRDWLLTAPASPFACLRRARGRFLPRPTPSYGRLLEAARAPERLADGISHAITFEPLRRVDRPDDRFFHRLATSERNDLADLDVPRFGFDASGRHIRDSRGEILSEMLSEAPFERIAQRLRTLDRQVCQFEAGLIARVFAPMPRISPAEPKASDTSIRLPDFLRSLADDVAANTVRQPSGMPQWLGPRQEASGLMYVAPLPIGLYAGTAGMALFMAAAARVLGDDRYGLVSRDALAGLDRLLAGPAGEWLAIGIGPGYGEGLGGILAAFAWCGTLLDDPALLRRGRALADHAAAAMQQDRRHDLLGGNAGLILGLLALNRAEPDRDLVSLAVRCGDRLLQGAERQGDGSLMWPFRSGPGLAGLSHGASGYALALAQLHAATGDGVWRRAAFDAFAYERGLFVPEAGNWRDLRERSGQSQKPSFMASWCHGAPGIALGRIGALELLAPGVHEEEALSGDLEAALATTIKHLVQNTDDLCCGNAGRIEILRTASRALSRPELICTADEKGLLPRLEASRAEGSCCLWHSAFPIVAGDRSLFKGTSGFGYAVARAIAPTLVPNVLGPSLPY